MPTDRFRHAFRVTAPPTVVYRHLMDPHSYIGMSPLVIAVHDVRPAVDAQGREAVAYVAIERFRFGPVRWDNHIRVTMTGIGPHQQVLSSVVSPGWVRLVSTVDLAGDGTGTSVTESIDLRTPWFVRRFALGQARGVQRARAAELARRMTSSDPGT